jgi:hypothetical protein
MNKSIIYIYLLDEGTDVWRPTEGEEVAEMTFRVLPSPNYNPEDEHWAYLPGTIVRCAYKTLSAGKSVLVAVEEA